MTDELLKARILKTALEYPVGRITLFGSRANGTNRSDSDVDLIVEFTKPVSLLLLSRLKSQLEEQLGLEVDLVHGPLQEGDLLEVGKEIELYAAQGQNHYSESVV